MAATPSRSALRAYIESLVTEVAVGADPDSLRPELLRWVTLWLRRQASERSARVALSGRRVDADEIESRILEAGWQAVRGWDFKDASSLMGLLRLAENHGAADAGRATDEISKDLRKLVRQVDTEVKSIEQETGRALSNDEREAIARRAAGDKATEETVRIAAYGVHINHLTRGDDYGADNKSPAEAAVDNELRTAVEEAVASLPAAKQRAVRRWMESGGTRRLPKSVADDLTGRFESLRTWVEDS